MIQFCLKALILHALKEVINNSGNTFVESEALYRFITTRYQIKSFEFNQYLKMIDLLVREKKIHKEGNVIFDLILYQEECVLAEKVVGLLKNPHQLIKVYDQKDIDRALRKVIGQSMEYSEKQKKQLRRPYRPIVIITGGPGTGKTTIVHAIIKMFLELNGGNQHLVEEIALLAPTESGKD